MEMWTNMKLPAEYLIPQYQDRLYGAAFAVLQNGADAADAVQMTFIKYVDKDLEYKDEEHIRAWLFKTVINQAKDIRRSFFRSHKVSIEAAINLHFEQEEDQTLFETVCQLPEKDRTVLQLYYYEDYPIKEIARILGIRESNVKKRLSRARSKLKNVLQENWNDENE